MPDLDPKIAPNRGIRTSPVLRGVLRSFLAQGCGALAEFPLRSGRRAEVIALSPAGAFTIVEVKSSPEDFRADGKWHLAALSGAGERRSRSCFGPA